jgi:hypothetical protein
MRMFSYVKDIEQSVTMPSHSIDKQAVIRYVKTAKDEVHESLKFIKTPMSPRLALEVDNK